MNRFIKLLIALIVMIILILAGIFVLKHIDEAPVCIKDGQIIEAEELSILQMMFKAENPPPC